MDAAYLIRTMVDIKNGKSSKEAMDAYEGETIPRGKKEVCEVSKGSQHAPSELGSFIEIRANQADTVARLRSRTKQR